MLHLHNRKRKAFFMFVMVENFRKSLLSIIHFLIFKQKQKKESLSNFRDFEYFNQEKKIFLS